MTADLPPLAELDPAEAWKPWRPDAAHPWNLMWAAHLYRRAAFGAPPPASGSAWEGLQRAVRQGLDATLEQLLQEGPVQAEYDRVMDSLAPATDVTQLYQPGADSVLLDLQGWWLHRMLHTATPLRERLTLFWHNHFATSIAKVHRPVLMVRQNQLFRTHALGKFRPLVLAVSRDPAMLIWLDSDSNVKGQPNENYARELMELFTLGLGHYGEHDVREAARAFTGWHTSADWNGPNPAKPYDGTAYVFNAARHDDEAKTVLGQTGNWNGGDIVHILLEQPAAARFLVRKLYRQFISEAEAPPDRLLEPLANQLRASDHDLGAVVRTLLRSRLFFSVHAYRQRIKSPVEYLLGLVRCLDVQARPTVLAAALDDMGQNLFAPPSVKGWDGGKAWLNSTTLLARYNLAAAFLFGPPLRAERFEERVKPAEPIRVEAEALVRQHAGSDPERQVAFLLDLFLQGDCAPTTQQQLVNYLKGEAKGIERSQRLCEALHAILLLPEYQLA